MLENSKIIILIFFLKFTWIYPWAGDLSIRHVYKKNSGQKFESLIPSAGEGKRRRHPRGGRWEALANKTNLPLPFKMKNNSSSQSALSLGDGLSHGNKPQEISLRVQIGNLSSCRKATFQLLQNATWLELTALRHWACSFWVNSDLNKVGKNGSFHLFTSILITRSMFYYMRACNREKYSSNSTVHQSWVATHYLHWLIPSQ